LWFNVASLDEPVSVSAGLTPVVQEEETLNEAKIGLVTRQAPSGGTELTPGTEVTLIVGKRAAVVPEEEEPEEVEEEGTTP